MPYNLIWKEKQVIFEYSGVVTSSDILASNQQVCGDQRFDGLRWQVVLFDEVTRVDYEAKDVKLIAYLDMAAFRSNPNLTVLFVGDSQLMIQLHEEYVSHVAGRCWTTLRLESRDEVWRHIEYAKA